MHLAKKAFYWMTSAAASTVIAHAHAHAEPPSPSLCMSTETIAFSCQAGTKTVSLCVAPTAGKIDAVTYRYGKPGFVENEYVASASNRHRFYGSVEPASPRASVNMVWFKRGPTTYLITNCIGGGCAQDARLSVLTGNRIISNKSCAMDEEDRAWFAPELVKFGGEIADSQSKTDLLRLQEGDFPLREIYGIREVW